MLNTVGIERLEALNFKKLKEASLSQKYILGVPNYNILANPKYWQMFEYGEWGMKYQEMMKKHEN